MAEDVVFYWISKIILYKLNVGNPEVKKFIEFYWEVIENEIRGKKETDEVDSKSLPSIGEIAVYAKNI